MLKNKNISETNQVNPQGNSSNWSSIQEINETDLHSNAFLFDDGHVEIINQYFHVSASMAVYYQQIHTPFLNAECESVPECVFVCCGGVDA
jgi:hypothetical protein